MKSKHRSFSRRAVWIPSAMWGAALPAVAVPHAAGHNSKTRSRGTAPAVTHNASRLARQAPRESALLNNGKAPAVSIARTGAETGVSHGKVAPSDLRFALGIAPASMMRLTKPYAVQPTVAASTPQTTAPVVTGFAPQLVTAPPATPRTVLAVKTPAPAAAAKSKTVAQAKLVPAPPRLAIASELAKLSAPPARRGPADLSARHKDSLLLAQLEQDLNRSESSLNRATAELSRGQRQLAAFGDTLRMAMMEAGPDATGLHPFVKVAQRYAGTPYVWGGESGRGFDCSGFIIRVMRDLGYRALPHSAAEQFRYGLPIANALLKPGISHVGIYLGRRRFIHAAGTGLGTIVSSLDTPKFRAKYAGARRLVSQ